jgi:SSS family solute:Na+ symporter
MWMAIFAWSACFLVTIAVSLVSAAKPEPELRGLVYGLTVVPDGANEPWYRRPMALAMVVGATVVLLNIIFW